MNFFRSFSLVSLSTSKNLEALFIRTSPQTQAYLLCNASVGIGAGCVTQ